jgi:hypothetical protein
LPGSRRVHANRNRDNMTGKINGWKHILNTLGTHDGDGINEAID